MHVPFCKRFGGQGEGPRNVIRISFFGSVSGGGANKARRSDSSSYYPTAFQEIASALIVI
jgi:hypothetical protein